MAQVRVSDDALSWGGWQMFGRELLLSFLFVLGYLVLPELLKVGQQTHHSIFTHTSPYAHNAVPTAQFSHSFIHIPPFTNNAIHTQDVPKSTTPACLPVEAQGLTSVSLLLPVLCVA